MGLGFLPFEISTSNRSEARRRACARRWAGRALAITLIVGSLPAALSASSSSALEPDEIEEHLAAARFSSELGEPQLAEHHDRLAASMAWSGLGQLSLLEGELDAAEAAFARAAASAPSFALTARALLAATRSSLGDLPAALAELRLLVSAAPEYALARRELVRALAAGGTFDEAATELEALRGLDAAAAAELEPLVAAAVAEPQKAVALLTTPPRPHVGLDGPDRAAERARLEQALAEAAERRQSFGAAGAVPFDGRALAEWLIERIEPPGEAEAELLARVDADAGDIAARQRLARLHLAADRRPAALEQLRQAAELGELERDLAYVLADLEARESRLPASNRQLRTLVKNHASPAGHLSLAQNARTFGRLKMAHDHSKRAHTLAPAAEAPLRAFVAVGFEAGLASSLGPAVETLARMRPDDAVYAYFVGRMWMELGDTGQAAEALQRALELDGQHAGARRDLGLALTRESRFEQARGHLLLFLEATEDPDSELDVQAALAECEERLGEAEAAEQRARQVLEREPQHAVAQLVLGLVLSGRGEFGPARQALESAVASDAKLAKAHYQLSFACARLGDRECAREHLALYRRALEGDQADLQLMRAVSKDGAKDGAADRAMDGAADGPKNGSADGGGLMRREGGGESSGGGP